MLTATDSRVQFRGSVFFFSLILLFGFGQAIESADAQTIWAKSFSVEPNGEFLETVQRIDAASNTPEIVIENQFGLGDFNVDLTKPMNSMGGNGDHAVAWSFSLHDESIFSVTSQATTRVERWDALTGGLLAPVILDESLTDHTLAAGLASRIAHAVNGDLLISSHGLGIEQRGIARYSSSGKHLVDYSHPKLMHQHGSVVATDDSVFVISRYNDSGTWVEKVLAFAPEGDFVGELDVPVGSPTDLAIWNNELVVMGANHEGVESGGLNLYQLNGEGLPQFSHTVDYPDGVDPLARHLGSVAYEDGLFYVTERADVHQISRTGELLDTFTVETFGDRPDHVGEIFVTSGASQVPEPSGSALCLLAMVAFAVGRRALAGCAHSL